MRKETPPTRLTPLRDITEFISDAVEGISRDSRYSNIELNSPAVTPPAPQSKADSPGDTRRSGRGGAVGVMALEATSRDLKRASRRADLAMNQLIADDPESDLAREAYELHKALRGLKERAASVIQLASAVTNQRSGGRNAAITDPK